MSGPAEYRTNANVPRRGKVERRLVAASSVATGLLARTSSMRSASVPVVEYPKCGGTWLSSMLGSYLDLPFPRQSLLPVTFPSITHGHWSPRRGPRHGVFLTRHPLDVAISFLFHTLRAPVGRGGFWEQQLTDRCGPHFRDRDVEDLVTPWMQAQHDLIRSHRTWAGFTQDWVESGHLDGAFVVVRYEDLIDSGPSELDRIVDFLGYPTDTTRRDLAIARFDFTTVTGRARGVENRSSFTRSASPGDWKKYAEQIEHVGLLDAIQATAKFIGY